MTTTARLDALETLVAYLLTKYLQADPPSHLSALVEDLAALGADLKEYRTSSPSLLTKIGRDGEDMDESRRCLIDLLNRALETLAGP